MNIKLKDKTVDTKQLVQWITALMQHHNIKAFYNSALWKRLRLEVLKEQHNECQVCKANGVFEEATTVHHIKYVRRYPELALTKNNLLAVCKECHYNIHHKIEYKSQLNVERW